ncbi:NEAT domain-containing protein [Peptoniphilus sp. DNF00840]|uniref:NEAT domain-containing protein n=1 Tax=Peptoniphilus sp. DNF00840 TaxID=1477000 RepID=UPI000785B862|nr:NEAT domain-containing protein [Peptoniphilus sp. DNF00840]KXB70768.1 iron transport-associated domain protein [Peptoniphilus sp. DNF00840]
MKNKKIYISLVFLLSLLFLTNFVFADNESTPEKKEINLEDGCYEIPIKLWHAIEEKPSMGNKALVQRAEIEVKNKEANLYIGSDKMEYMSITASLVNIYFQKEDGIYRRAEAGCYDLDVPKEKDKRPRVFRTSLINMDEMTKVYVDPKVEPMGDEPIRARIKLDFDKIKKINESEATLIKKFKDGPKKPDFNSKEAGEVQNKNLIVNYGPETFKEEFSFYGNKLSGKQAEEFTKSFDKLDQVNVFKIEFLGPLEEITGKEESIQAKRKKIYANKEFDLKLPLLKFKGQDKLSLYEVKNGEKKKINYKVNGDYLEFKTKDSAIFIVVKGAGSGGQVNKLIDNKNLPTLSNISTSPSSSKIERAKAFMATVKKPQAQKISSSSDSSSPMPVEGPQVSSTPLSISPPSVGSLQSKIASQENKGASSKENKNKEGGLEGQEIEEKESKGIIILILLIFIGLNATAFIVIRKNLQEVKDMKDEMMFLGGLKENEKNNK